MMLTQGWFEVWWCRTHPLTPAQHEALVERVKGGGSFCCADGKKWLESVGFDETWTRMLNEWAYEALACKDHAGDRDGYYSSKVRELSLDVPPGGLDWWA